MKAGNINRLQKLYQSGQQHLLRGGLKGLEKESLRLAANGMIAQTPHPEALGSALTHPWITTDYSEALMELITPAFVDPAETLGYLDDLHSFVYQHLGDDYLLATSMPIGLAGDESIPIARYGTSNIGQMKHIYRRGLGYRYGRTMQAIAGVHFNYSVNEALWPVLKELEGNTDPLRKFIADSYFGAIRNIYRYGWLLIYLFGCSPAVCKSFFIGREELAAPFSKLDSDTLFRPGATSLRMSDIGYRNDSQAQLDVSFNALDDYVTSLTQAIRQPHPPYERIGVKVDGEYRQLNANILQIENEYYSLVRPKQVAESGEKPTLALKRRGVRYLELRALDLDCFEPSGIGLEQLRFLEIFVLYCLLADSPLLYGPEKMECGRNHLATACCGRNPEFRLIQSGLEITLADWAEELFDGMGLVAEIIDDAMSDQGGKAYSNALRYYRSMTVDSGGTRSARVLSDLRLEGMSFANFARTLSARHAKHWCNRGLSTKWAADLVKEAIESRALQRRLEEKDAPGLDDFLAEYFGQG